MHPSLLLVVLPLAFASPTGKRSSPAPLLVPRGAASRLIPDEYIVKLKKGSATGVLKDVMEMLPSPPSVVFESVFKGFTGKLDSPTLEAMQAHPDVDYIEQNAKVQAYGLVTQRNAPWGLARISHRATGATDYVYDESAGEGTCVYVVDSGLDDQHAEFEGRAEEVKSFIGGSGDNCLHGTHVAGTVGSRSYGVAKKANIYGIKVLDYNTLSGKCEAANSVIIAGMEHVSKDAANRDCPNGIVVNMSLGGSFSQMTNDAAAALVRKGYFVAVAAGNGDEKSRPLNAAEVSPASAASVCTIGSVDVNNHIAFDSNYGPGVDLHGPGVKVTSVRAGGGFLEMSGTSMATPHIAGLGAYFLALGKSADTMCEYLQSLALQGVIQGLYSGTQNLLAQNGVYA
ncbi:Proteinase R [Neonectria ditissima]|uniref:Proteinase R n=1 Tax=Neonectria ditissima TaxID=78410 RepID=A0A0P7BY18_9HYPO|nr:Proteinase R [Neonectria ditissima]